MATNVQTICVGGIRLSRPLLLSLKEMCDLASTPQEQMVAQLLETSIAEFRRHQIPPDFLLRRDGTTTPIQASGEVHRRKITPVLESKILNLRDAGVPVSQVAIRCGVSQTAVRLVEARRDDDEN